MSKPKRKHGGPVEVVTQVPAVEHREPVVQDRGHVVADHRYWPVEKPLPTAYHRPPQPCPECRRVLLDNGGRAVKVAQTWGGFAYLACQGCGHRWKWRIVRG